MFLRSVGVCASIFRSQALWRGGTYAALRVCAGGGLGEISPRIGPATAHKRSAGARDTTADPPDALHAPCAQHARATIPETTLAPIIFLAVGLSRPNAEVVTRPGVGAESARAPGSGKCALRQRDTVTNALKCSCNGWISASSG